METVSNKETTITAKPLLVNTHKQRWSVDRGLVVCMPSWYTMDLSS